MKLPKNTYREVYIGIDPGASGGLAAIYSDWPETGKMVVGKMPTTDRDVFDWFPPYTAGPCYAVIEKVGGYVGGKGNPGSAMFKFGQSYGALRMALTAAGIPFEEVTPQKWQRGLGIVPRKRDESKTAWKNRLKAKAQQLFPGVTVTLAVADALLIAEYCRRMRRGTLNEEA